MIYRLIILLLIVVDLQSTVMGVNMENYRPTSRIYPLNSDNIR